MTNEEQIKKWKKQLEEYDKKRVAELNEIRSAPSVPISSRNKDADNSNFFGGLLGGLLPGSSIADAAIKNIRKDQTLQQEAKKQGIDLNNLYTTQENLNMFGADLGRTVEATGAGISSALSNLGKGTLIAARNMGALSSVVDKAITDLRAGTENAQIEKLKSKAKEKGIDTVTLDEYLDKAKNTKTSLERINDFSANTFDKWSNEANQRIVELQGETENDFAKKAIGFMPNLSQQAVTIGASLINPVLGTSVATGQAMGSYYNDAKSRGMTDEQANDFSQIMGIVEGATEMIGVDKLVKAGKGAKALAKGGLKSARKELSKEVITSTFGNLLSGAMDNFMQEAITEPIQEGVADWIAGKGNWENIDQRMLEAGINGAITSLITGGANIGVQSAVGVASRIKNGQPVTQQEVNQGLVDTLAETDNLSKEEKQEFADKYVTPGIKTAQDVARNKLNQVPTEPNRAVPMQTSENVQQQVQEQEQQVISNQNENALNQNVEPQNLVESAERSGIDVKDEKTRKNLEVIQKFNENRGIKATFDADAFKGHDNINSFFRTDENGNREIVFNPNTMTDKTIQQLAVHEVYHDMVAGGTAQELTDFVIQKMSSNPEYQEYVRALQDVYEEQDSDIIKEEAVAHYLEKNLGTNKFISELQERGDRTTIQRIIDTIKDMITKAKNTLTGKGDLNYLLDLQRKYEQAYRGEFKGTQEQTKLSKQVNEYQGSHQIDTENSTSLNNLDLNDIESKVKQVNGALSKQDISDLNKLKKLKDNDTITIYRASPVNELNNGDWVTTDKSYAQNVAKENGGKVYSYEVNANELLYPNNVKDLPSLHRLSSFQYNSQDNIQENTISNQPTTDNQGRTLTKEQQEYFKDSKVRDENGNLLEVYHGTPNGGFTTFDRNKISKSATTHQWGYGFYFSNNSKVGDEYTRNYNNATEKYSTSENPQKYTAYLDIKNPFIISDTISGKEGHTLDRNKLKELILKGDNEWFYDSWIPFSTKTPNELNYKLDGLTEEQIKNLSKEEKVDYWLRQEYDERGNQNILQEMYRAYNNVRDLMDNFKKILGYDGIIVNGQNDTNQYIVFEPNQIKNVDNTNPTENADIRYSKEAPTKDNQGRELSKGQQERLKNAKTVDEDGNVLELYHFTPSGDFTIFDKTRANPESDMGAGFYFTNSKIDGQQNYQDENGADIRNRIDRLAEQIESEEDITYEEAREKAEQQVLQGGSSFNVYLDIENPAYIGGENETRLFTQEDIRKYAEENDLGYDFENEEDAYDNALADYVENITTDLYDTYSFDEVQQIQRAIYDAIYENDFEGINVQQLKDKLNDPDNFIEIYDNNGNLVTNEIARQIVENIGYDGIIDNTVSSKFNMNLDPDTTHYIAFRPEQIKNVTNLNPTDNPDINLSKQGTGTSQEIINNFLENTKVNEGTGTAIKDLARVPIQQETQVETKTKEAPVSQETTQDYLTHHPDYYDGDQFDFNAHRTEVINKANQDIVDIIKNSSNLREDLQRAYDLNEKNDVVDIKTGQDEDNRLTYQQKETILSSLLRSKDIENSDLYKSLMEDTTPRQVAPSEAPAQVPQVNEVKQRQVEPIRDITDVQRPQVPQNQKTRKTYESIINSNQMTQEAKQIAKELMGYDTYVPQTNEFTLAVADRNIKQNGVDESLTTLTNKINNNDRVNAVDIATGERLIEYYSKIGDREKLQEAIQTTAMAGTEAGRAVQAMSMISHQTPIGQVTWIQRSVDKVNKRLAKEGRKAQFNFTPEMQQKILNSTSENLQQNLNEVYQELGKQVPKSNMEKFNEWRYFSMLANPKTHFRNILGNLVMAQVQRAKNKVAGTIEDFVIGDNAERWNSLKGASKGMYEFAKNDLKNADVQSMLGLNENKYNPQSRLQQNQRTFKSDLLEKTLGKLFNLNSKLLEVEDGWGLKSGYAKAMANYLNANNLDYNNLTDAQLQKARQYAVQQAKEATFHQENTVANMLQTLENKNLFTKVALGGAIPFKKTPMNVALTGFEYSPAGFAKTLTTDLVNLRKGKISANQFIDNISKNLTGTAITLVGYGLTQAGILKASGSGDEDKDEFEEATGKQNYSIQIGDKTYSLDWLTPAGIPLFIGSELYQVSHQKEDGNKTKNENEAFKSITKILDATASAMNPMSEMTMISGLTNALKSYAQGSTKSIENMLANVGKSYVTQTVPTALGQIARSTDEYERSTTSTETDPMAKAIDSAKNQIISKIPGLRETLPVSTDVWGNERETQSYEENAILPWTSKEISQDPVNKALTDLYDATGESGVLPDNYIDKSLTIDKEKYKLTNEEYARLKQQYGKTAHDILADLTKSKEYEQMSDEQKVKAVKEAYSYAKSTLKVTYSDENNLDAEESSTYKKVQSVIDNGGDAKEYFEYTGLIDGVKKEKEKRQILLNSNLKDKGAIYESTIGSDDETYQIMKATGIDPDAYLDYKQQDFSSDKEDDGTVKGKTVSGSGKTKFYDYMDNADMTYEQKLLLTGMKYKLLPGERDTLANYIDTLPISASEKTDIYKKLKGATVYQNGEIYY